MAKSIDAYSIKTLSERDRACLWHPFTQMGLAQDPIAIVKAEGSYLYAEDGRGYLDAISSWWVNLHGHAHPYIIEKIGSQAKQFEHLIFADFTHLPAIELAESLLEILPGNMGKIFFSDNGSTAVEAAIKIALQYWYNEDPATKKRKVICYNRGYHGDTFGAMSVSGKCGFNRPFWSHLFEVHTIDPPLQGKEEESLLQLKDILRDGDAACFIFEPLILGASGMVIYSPSGLNGLMKICKEHNVLCIADEVMTGFGRTGSLFACDQIEEEPDMICLSKGLTGGFMALGATACKEFIYDRFVAKDISKAFLHGHSYTGNPLACAAALASLDLLVDKNCSEQRRRIAESHRNFCAAKKENKKLKRCEALGTVLALEYDSKEDNGYFHSMRDLICRFFLDRGILIRPIGNVIYLLPPYCITGDELSYIYDQINEILEELL
jgi:adenosylmethionine-8-amino-7-oxononanoate aminotransferase